PSPATSTPRTHPLSLHDALPISYTHGLWIGATVSGLTFGIAAALVKWGEWTLFRRVGWPTDRDLGQLYGDGSEVVLVSLVEGISDRKSTRLNSSHVKISYAVFCL